MAREIKIITTFTTFQIYQISLVFKKIYYHVISYYLILIILTTLHRIRLLIITYAEKFHIAKLKLNMLNCKKDRPVRMIIKHGTNTVLAVQTTSAQWTSTLKYVGRNT